MKPGHEACEEAGAIGNALAGLAQQHGTLTACAKAIGCGIESLGRWIREEAKPSPKYSERICELNPGLRDLLKQHGCFINPAKRPRVFNRPKSMSPRAMRRRGEWTAGRQAAAKRAKKLRRLDLIKRRHALMLRKQRGKAKRLRSAEPAHRNRVSHRGDFIEHVSELTTSDVGFVPTYKMEGP